MCTSNPAFWGEGVNKWVLRAGWLAKTPRSRFNENYRKFVSHPFHRTAVCGLRKENQGGPIRDLKESLVDQGHRKETENCPGHTYDGSLLVHKAEVYFSNRKGASWVRSWQRMISWNCALNQQISQQQPPSPPSLPGLILESIKGSATLHSRWRAPWERATAWPHTCTGGLRRWLFQHPDQLQPIWVCWRRVRPWKLADNASTS